MDLGIGSFFGEVISGNLHMTVGMGKTRLQKRSSLVGTLTHRAIENLL
jgi:hypothetical protein